MIQARGAEASARSLLHMRQALCDINISRAPPLSRAPAPKERHKGMLNAEGETSRQPSPEREPFELPRAYAHQLSRLAPYRTRRPRQSARAHRVRCYKDSPRAPPIGERNARAISTRSRPVGWL